MNKTQTNLIAQAILDVTGVAVTVSTPKIAGVRSSLFAYVTGYSAQNGPRFTIQPHGLKSHKVTAEMGIFALPCIRLMQCASDDQIALARCLINQIASRRETSVTIHPNQTIDDWCVTDTGFKIEIITRTSAGQYEDEAVTTTASNIMAPLLAAIAELIGYVDLDGEEIPAEKEEFFDVEGKLTTTLVKKRERSRRNRMLCLAIHGDRCAVCNAIPTEMYPGLPSIIEVHHIEPVSTLTAPKVYNPSTDLIPLCPNCHRAIHKSNPAMLPNDLRNILKFSA
jgi:5-methylcytosine-specific restriction protein A